MVVKKRSGILWLVLTMLVFSLISCTNHFKAGMKAYADEEYGEAVNNLSQVKSDHPDYDLAMATLVKAEFKLALHAFNNASDPAEAIKHLKKMVPLATKTKSKEFVKEAMQALLQKIRKAKDPIFVKDLMVEKVKLLFN